MSEETGQIEALKDKLCKEVDKKYFGWEDFIIPAKIVWQFSKENPNLKILGGFLENSFIIKGVFLTR